MKKIAILATLFLCACATAKGPEFDPTALTAPQGAQIVVYRPSNVIGSARNPMIEVNGVDKCKLPQNGFAVLDANPGSVTVGVAAYGVSRTTVIVKKNQRYYMKVTPNMGQVMGLGFGGLVGGAIVGAASYNDGFFKINEVTKSQAESDLVGFKQGGC